MERFEKMKRVLVIDTAASSGGALTGNIIVAGMYSREIFKPWKTI